MPIDPQNLGAWPREMRALTAAAYGPMVKNRKRIVAELAGKNVALWCKLGERCNADVLIEVANSALPHLPKEA